MVSAGRPSPPQLLAELLAEDRALGFDFESSWVNDLDCVLTTVSTRTSWRHALEGMREDWRASWANEPGPRERLSLDLTDDASDQASSATVLG